MAHMPTPLVPVSWGELLDKITILEIKRERLVEPGACANVARELAALRTVGAEALACQGVRALFAALKAVNEELWEVEDAIRAEEALGLFGEAFVRLARTVYERNDRRAALKGAINALLKSELVEEKSYWTAPATAPAEPFAAAMEAGAARPCLVRELG